MKSTPYEVVPEPRRRWTRTLGPIGISDALDGVMRAAFAAADLIPRWVSPVYTGTVRPTPLRAIPQRRGR